MIVEKMRRVGMKEWTGGMREWTGGMREWRGVGMREEGRGR